MIIAETRSEPTNALPSAARVPNVVATIVTTSSRMARIGLVATPVIAASTITKPLSTISKTTLTERTRSGPSASRRYTTATANAA
jgi:hypothetical protein